jgi:hypothetical protein
MRPIWHRSSVVGLLAALLALTSCGESGEEPPMLAEARFEIRPARDSAGVAQFEVVDVQTNGQRFTSLAGIPISAHGPFTIYIENAAEPFGLTVRLLGTVPIEVQYSLGGQVTAVISDPIDTPGVDVAVGTTSATAALSRPESRVDVCAPMPDQSACSAFDDMSVFGAPISGSIGDTESTRLIGRLTGDDPEVVTPAVYFFANPKNNIAAVVRADDHRFLRVRLWVDGALEDEEADTNDVVVKVDL